MAEDPFASLFPQGGSDQSVVTPSSGVSALATEFGYNDPEDNGIGAWGQVTNDPNVEGVSLPIPVLQNAFGNANQAKGQLVRVTNPETGKSVVAPIVDKGPADWVVARQGNTIDLTHATNKAIGGTGKTPVEYEIVQKDPFADLFPEQQKSEEMQQKGAMLPQQQQTEDKSSDPFSDLFPATEQQQNPSSFGSAATSIGQGFETKRPVGFLEAAGRGVVGGRAKIAELMAQGVGIFPYVEDKTLQAFGVNSDIYNRYIKAVHDTTGLGKPTEEAVAIKPTEQLTTGGQIGLGLGEMGSQLPEMIMTGAVGAAERTAQSAFQFVKPLMPRITESIQAMIPMAAQSGSDAVIQSAQQGDNPVVQAAKGIAQATTTAAIGAVPLSARSKIVNPLGRFLEQGAYGYITGLPIGEQQKVVDSWVNGKPYVPSEWKDMAIQAIPMGIMTGAFGILHAPKTQAKIDAAAGGPEPTLAPSENPIVEQRTEQILNSAESKAPVPIETTPATETPVADKETQLNDLFAKQWMYPPQSPEHIDYQRQIDELTKPAETPPKQEPSVAEQAPQAVLGAGETPAVEPTAEAPVAEAQPQKPNAIQIASAEETMLRPQIAGEGEVVELPRVGEQKPEVPATEGQAPKEEVAPNYAPEVQAKLDDLKKRTDESKKMLKFYLDNKIIFNDEYQKRLKGLGMEAAAEKRRITGELTAKEQARKTKREEGNYKGKPVSVEGKNGTVVGNPFGRVKVRFEDGTESTHLPEKIEAPVKAEETPAPKAEVPKETTPVEQQLELSGLEQKANDARKRIKRRKNEGRQGMGVDPDNLIDWGIIAANHVAKGVKTFAEFSRKMLAEFGKVVKPHLENLWNQAKAYNEKLGRSGGVGRRPSEDEAALKRKKEEAKYGPKATPEQEQFVKDVNDSYVKQLGKPIPESLIGSILSQKYKGISPSEISDLYATATGKPKPPVVEAPVTEEVPKGEATSLKNAYGKLEREKFGLNEPSKEDEQEMKQSWERSGETASDDPLAGKRLADSFIADPTRPLSGDDSALLLRYKTDLFNSLNKLADQLFEGSPNEKFEKGLEYDNARSDFENLLDALNKRGTEWGREGRWRQALVKEDYSFVTQERVARAAKRENLTKPEQERLKKDTDLLEKNEKRIKELQEQIKNDQERSKLEKEVAQEPKVDPYIQSLIDKIRKNVKSLAEQYREELRKKAKEGRLMTGIDPTDIHKYAVIGADHLLEGISDFSRWSEKMISDWGEKIRPHLDEIFNKAKQFNEQQINKETKGSASDKKKVVKATSPEESRRKAQVTRARNRLAELKAEEERVNKGDFTKKEKRPPLEPSEEVNRLREESAKIKDRIDQQRIKWERANRKTTSKVLDFIARLNRVNILSHLSVFEHLAGAAVENIVTRPMGSIAAQLFRFSKTLDAIRRKAVYEGGLSPKSEFKGITGVLKSLPNVWNKLTKGKTGMDWLHGDKKHPKEFLSIVENTHAAIKEPVRQGIYSRSLQLRIEAAEKAGLDPTHDEALTTILSAEAYNDANMDIFMGDNFLSKKLRAFIDGKVKDHERVGKFFSTLMEIALPIVNVSTNIAIRKARLLFGLAESAGRLIAVAGEGKLANGAEKLTQKEAELITRSFKYGVMGLALGVYAWTNPDKFGGIYSPVGTQAPKNKKLEKGQIKIGSVTVPKEMTHGPVGGFMNMIADARRLYDSKIRGNRNSKWSGVSEATFFSALVSGIGNIPVTQTALRWTSPFTSAAQKTGQQVRETFIPGMLQDAAKIIDPTKRIPKDFIDELEMGIPYLRKNVPVSHRR